MPASFYAPSQAEREAEEMEKKFRDAIPKIMKSARQTNAGMAVTLEEFLSFCLWNNIDFLEYKKWLRNNDYIVTQTGGGYNMYTELDGKMKWCVVFR